MTPNIAASVRQRLLNISKERGEQYQNLLLRYGIERFIYRLSLSPYSGDFILKGANLFYVWTGDFHRPTRDLDLLLFGSDELSEVTEIFVKICQTEVVDDGIAFDADSIRTDRIRDNSIYAGARVKLTAHLAGAVIPLQIDVGVGDDVFPDAAHIAFPTVLDFPSPTIRAYRFETAIAEKLEAMIKLGRNNSRMKDFYDIYVLARDFDFEGATLQRSIQRTLERRGTPLPQEPLIIWRETFSADQTKQKQWRAFLRKSGLSEIPFHACIQTLRRFLEPILYALSNDMIFSDEWQKGRWRGASRQPSTFENHSN